MKFSERIREAIKVVVTGRVREVEVGAVDADDHLYRPLTGANARDLSPLKRDRATKVAAFLYTANPLAHRLTEDMRDWVVGEGITIRHENETLQAVLDANWGDPINKWSLAQHDLIRDLGLFGELCLPVFVKEATGRVRYGVLDSERIASVKTDPENATVPIEVIVKGRKPLKERTLKVVQMDEEESSPTLGRMVGQVLYFAVNKFSTASRGLPDLLAVADFLDAYDQSLFDDLERTVMLKRVVFDLTVDGADAKKLKEKAAMLKDLKPGAVYAHNKNEELKAVVPDMKAADASKAFDLWRRAITNGAGFPEPGYASTGKLGETGRELSIHVIKRIKARQQFVRRMMEKYFRFVLDQWWIANAEARKGIDPRLASADPDVVNEALHAFQVVIPEPTDLDLARVSDSVLKVEQAIALAGESISETTRQDLRGAVYAALGVELETATGDAVQDGRQPDQDERDEAAKEAEEAGSIRLHRSEVA